MGASPEKAKAALETAERTVEEWKEKEAALRGSLAEAEEEVGYSALATGDVEGAARAVTDLREQVDVAGSTVAAAEAQRGEAQRELWRAEATALFSEADRLDRDAQKHGKKTREILDALESHEGGRYVPEQPSPLVASNLRPWTPKSEQMRNLARAKRAEGERLLQRARASEAGRGEPSERAAEPVAA